jgi:hypothetical protein
VNSIEPVRFEKALEARGDVYDAPLQSSRPGQDAFSIDPSSLIDLAELTSVQDIKRTIQELWLPAFQEYTVDATTIHSSFDITRDSSAVNGLLDLVAEDSVNDPAADVLGAPQTYGNTPSSESASTTPVTPNGPLTYDEDAREYIDYIMSSGEIELVYTQNHVILIDVDVFSNPMAKQFAQTWNFSGGGSISLIGLHSDYMDYLMHG